MRRPGPLLLRFRRAALPRWVTWGGLCLSLAIGSVGGVQLRAAWRERAAAEDALAQARAPVAGKPAARTVANAESAAAARAQAQAVAKHVELLNRDWAPLLVALRPTGGSVRLLSVEASAMDGRWILQAQGGGAPQMFEYAAALDQRAPLAQVRLTKHEFLVDGPLNFTVEGTWVATR